MRTADGKGDWSSALNRIEAYFRMEYSAIFGLRMALAPYTQNPL
jgi:hypothetical protein